MKGIGNGVRETILNSCCVVLTVLVLLVLLGRLVVSSQSDAGKDAYLFGYRLGIVMTDSMEPAIPTYSLLLEKKMKVSDEISIGDVVSYFYPLENRQKIRITHRVIEMESGKLTMKGDQNNQCDLEKIEKEDVLSKVVVVIPNFVRWLAIVFGIIIVKMMYHYLCPQRCS